MAMMVGYWQKLNNDNSGELCYFPQVSLNFHKFTLYCLMYHHSHFLAATLNFTSFLPWIFGGCTPFLQLGFFALDITYYCNCIWALFLLHTSYILLLQATACTWRLLYTAMCIGCS